MFSLLLLSVAFPVSVVEDQSENKVMNLKNKTCISSLEGLWRAT